MLVTTPTVILEARPLCQAIAGADLVSIEDQEEQDFFAGKTLTLILHSYIDFLGWDVTAGGPLLLRAL